VPLPYRSLKNAKLFELLTKDTLEPKRKEKYGKEWEHYASRLKEKIETKLFKAYRTFMKITKPLMV